jgi:3,4-dihydroxy 2-butanone 4-phosphate synthase/GTP cyclohydrolase II
VLESDLPTDHGVFKAIVFENEMNGETHVAMVMGDVGTTEPVLVRVQTENVTFAMFGSTLGEASRAMQASLQKISEGRTRCHTLPQTARKQS